MKTVIDNIFSRVSSVFTDTETEPETVPKRCPHCGTPTTVQRLVDKKTGEATKTSWGCPACGASKNSEPKCSPDEARRRYREAGKQMQETAERLLSEDTDQ